MLQRFRLMCIVFNNYLTLYIYQLSVLAIKFDFLFFTRYATILAFDVKIERDAQDLADSLGVKIFQADIIYHLFDQFKSYRDELKRKAREEFKSIAVFPCKLRVSIILFLFWVYLILCG